MVYTQKSIGSHSHRWFIDGYTGDYVCICGVTKGNEVKRAKYHNHSQIYNGHTYDSKLEARYAAELDYRLKAKDIKGWERQIKIDLKVNGTHIANYYIDFIVQEKDGHYNFTEIKGLVLGVWAIKWKIFEATFDDHKRTVDDVMTVIKQVNTTYKKR